MKSAVFWIVVIAAVTSAAAITVARYPPASLGLQRFVSPGPLSPRHAYLADRCESCHETSVGVTAAKCTECHANAERLLSRQPTAFHASVLECAACHAEHQSTPIRPIALDHVELARVGVRTLARAAEGHLHGSGGVDAESAATLKSLETWLSIRLPDQLDEPSALTALNCVGCHSTKDRHVGLLGKDCAQCHATTQWTIPEFRHPSSRSTDCAQCHQAPPSHYMMHFDMIDKKIARQEDAQVAQCCGPAQVRQCFRCHQTTAWNDIRGVGYYKHH